jgi:hypothetical protein
MSEQGGQAVDAIENSVRRLLSRGLRYGTDSTLETIEFRQLTILPSGDSAEYERERAGIFHCSAKTEPYCQVVILACKRSRSTRCAK